MNFRRSYAKKVANLGLLFALALTVSLIEGMIPPLVPVPGIKLGLSNIVIMFCLVMLDKRQAFTLTVLKSLFIFFIRGAMAASLSLCGGVASIAVMCVALMIKPKINISIISVLGAVFHNFAQLALASHILGLWKMFWYYMPVLAVSGIIMGIITAVLFKLVRQHLGNFYR